MPHNVRCSGNTVLFEGMITQGSRDGKASPYSTVLNGSSSLFYSLNLLWVRCFMIYRQSLSFAILAQNCSGVTDVCDIKHVVISFFSNYGNTSRGPAMISIHQS